MEPINPPPLPVPVLPLHSPRVERPMPPVLTGVAVTSIVIGCLSVLGNLVYAVPPAFMALFGAGMGSWVNPHFCLYLIEPALWVSLATYLFFAGVLLVAGEPAACRHHRRYALVKIVTSVLATAVWWPNGSYFLADRGSPAPPETGMQTLVFLAISLVYPVVLLWLLNTRRARAFAA